MNDAFEGQASSGSENGMTKRNWTVPRELTKGAIARLTFDRPGDAVRNEEPPRDDVAIPWVDDGIDPLAEKVPINHDVAHGVSSQLG